MESEKRCLEIQLVQLAGRSDAPWLSNFSVARIVWHNDIFLVGNRVHTVCSVYGPLRVFSPAAPRTVHRPRCKHNDRTGTDSLSATTRARNRYARESSFIQPIPTYAPPLSVCIYITGRITIRWTNLINTAAVFACRKVCWRRLTATEGKSSLIGFRHESCFHRVLRSTKL